VVENGTNGTQFFASMVDECGANVGSELRRAAERAFVARCGAANDAESGAADASTAAAPGAVEDP
jgi:hypothetical protein